MTDNVIERAYQLAPASVSIDEIRAKLKREGFAQVDAHLAGKRIKEDLVKLIRQNR